MSHLGDLLSAHVDGELDGAEQDKVSVHLAHCERCRAEAAELRALKRKIGELATHVPGEQDMTQRLLEIAEIVAVVGPAGPVANGNKIQTRKHRVLSKPGGLTGPGGSAGPGGRTGRGLSRLPKLSRRRKYVVLGAVSIVVSLGTAAFSVGGSDPAPGPRIIPQYELYSEEHAITSGGVPMDGPGPVMDPAMSAATSTASAAARQP
jgi:hypothetical protein